MNQIINEMLRRYNSKTPEEYKNALKEIMQEIALLGLSRQNFFNKAAFYGGTALRIAYQSERFSEDLDFTLTQVDRSFDIGQYLKGIEDEFTSFGLTLTTEKRTKRVETTIDSAFLKANTLEHLLMIEGLQNPASGTNKNDIIKIKLEIDTDPPKPSGGREILYLTRPTPFSYQILTLPSLFAGKLHALLCRKYKSGRIKGRDFYDFIWYINRNISPDLPYLEGKLRESKNYNETSPLTLKHLKLMLDNKFKSTDWEQAKADVLPFIKDKRVLEVWSTDFFISLIPLLK